ncbi:TetR/AcrR family transcriptional regulator [Nocardioides seonyuensis]|uniref:TetR/AcrR family transcriptional regulator n=1 Tax=Nocardioides seonyuensis TaxID=2518371 RepID=UPI0014241C7E|nr:TetR/AcrR family transcriptional regulator [Nocardioides seonyuensis]
MSDLAPSRRRPRSDALRSRTALIHAAIHVLADDPDADLARVATTAGLSRQTLYAHFGSRSGLLDAVVHHITGEAAGLIRDARLEQGTARDALVRYLDVFSRMPSAWTRVAATATEGQSSADSAEVHRPVVDPLAAIVRRGQDAGEFTTDLPAAWLSAATVALGHAAHEQESRGELTREQARAALRTTLLRLYGAGDD